MNRATCFIFTLILVLLSGCTQPTTRTLDDLESLARTAFEENDASQIFDAIYWEGGDKKIEEMMAGLFKSMDLSQLPLTSLETYAFDAYTPDTDLPGSMNGKELAWIIEPTHWVIAESSDQDSNGYGSHFKLDLAAAEVDGNWWFIGIKDSGKRLTPKERLYFPGLTDSGVTAIAFNEAGKITDFVHIVAGSGISQIEFPAPETGESIYVSAIGPELDSILSPDVVVSSQVGEYYLGKVTVDVNEDRITAISGNTISQDNPLNHEDYAWLQAEILSGTQKTDNKVTIIKDGE